jgi:alpha-glucosidase (family GH31 glycosyl hydrolase)
LQLIDDFQPDTYNYLLGDHILVCPVISNPANVTVTFPSKSGIWFDFWNSSNCYQGGDTYIFYPDLTTLPVFIQTGALLPLRITDSLTGFGDQTFSDALTLYVGWPDLNVKHKVEIRDSASGMTAEYWMASDSTQLHFEVTAHPSEKVVIVFQHIPRPKQIDGQFVCDSRIESSIREHSSLDSLTLIGYGFWWDSYHERVVIRPGSIELGAFMVISF